MYLTELQEKRFKRDEAIYGEYRELYEKHGGLVSRWRIARILSPKYGVCPMAIWRIVGRMGKYKGEDPGKPAMASRASQRASGETGDGK